MTEDGPAEQRVLRMAAFGHRWATSSYERAREVSPGGFAVGRCLRAPSGAAVNQPVRMRTAGSRGGEAAAVGTEERR
jgi:hypothetical protein